MDSFAVAKNMGRHWKIYIQKFLCFCLLYIFIDDIGDSPAGQLSLLLVGKQRIIPPVYAGILTVMLQIGLQQGPGLCHNRDLPGLVPFPMKRDHRRTFDADILYF